MSRYNPNRDLSKLFDAVEQWRERCLIEDGSLFGQESVWSLERLEATLNSFQNQQVTSGTNWADQLEDLLKSEPGLNRQLVAEVVWVLLLFPRAFNKKARLQRLWPQLDGGHPMLKDAILEGLDQLSLPDDLILAELIFLLEAFVLVKKEGQTAQRRKIFDHPFEFASGLDGIAGSETRVGRHTLPFLLLPDAFEPITNFKTKQAILAGLDGGQPAAKSKSSFSGYVIDQRLSQLRKRLENERDEPVDFLAPGMKAKWQSPRHTWLLDTGEIQGWNWPETRRHLEANKTQRMLVNTDAALTTGSPLLLVEDKTLLAVGEVVQERLQPGSWQPVFEIAVETVLPRNLQSLNLKKLGLSRWKEGTVPIAEAHASEFHGFLEEWQQTLNLIDIHHDEIRPSVNKIFYGPPGTGKTYRFNELKKDYETGAGELTRHEILQEKVKHIYWWKLLAVVLLKEGKPMKVSALKKHPYIVAKMSLKRAKSYYHVLQVSLQSHTIENSTTVNTKQRSAPFVFDKKEKISDARWVLLDNWEEDAPELKQLAESLEEIPDTEEKISRHRTVSFHQSYSYEEFVEGLRPDETGSLQPYDGIFKELCTEAKANQDKSYALFIDEINRGNVTAILGELISLLESDKRCVWAPDDSLRADSRGNKGLLVTLPYSKETFGIPKNLHIYASMNTADRSLAQFDVALRRRFVFEEILPDGEVLTREMENKGVVEHQGVRVELPKLLTRLNERLEYLLDRDHLVGHAYFLKATSWQALKEVFYGEIIPLLQEYFLDQNADLQAVLGKDLVVETTWEEKRIFGKVGPNKKRYTILPEAQLTPAILVGIYQ